MAKSNIRRTIIREWTSLAREKRQSRQQALAFTKAAVRTTSSATQPPNTGGHHHDLVAAAHRTTLKHVTKVAREKKWVVATELLAAAKLRIHTPPVVP